MRNKIIIGIPVLIFIVLVGCKKENLLDPNSNNFSFHGIVYFLVDSMKVPQRNIRVYLNNDMVRTDSVGEFEFLNLEAGEYTILFKYSTTPADTLISVSKQIKVPQTDDIGEFVLNDLHTFNGRVFIIIDSIKVPQNHLPVSLNNSSTQTDSSGKFDFKNLLAGQYTITFEYYNDNLDSLLSIPFQIIIPQSDGITDFVLTSLYAFSGRAFMIIDSVKVPQNNVDVYLNNDTTETNSLGEFEFKNLLSDQYTITFKYYESNLDSILLASYSIVIPQSNEITDFILPGAITVSGEVFSYVNNAKVYLENVRVKVGQYLTYTNYEGRFALPAPILPGDYNVFVGGKDFYSSIDSTFNISGNSYMEFELKSLINEDIIFINNDDYYYRYKNGDIIQLTSSGEEIFDDLEFSDQVDYFIYTSRNGSEYHLNLVNLNSHQHNILYSSTTKITQPTISPDGSRIYMIREHTVGYVTFGGNIFHEVFSWNYTSYPGYLFHDCEKVITLHRSGLKMIAEIINFVTNDTTEAFYHYDGPLNIQEISPDDKYVSFLVDYDPYWCTLYETRNGQMSGYGAVIYHNIESWGWFFDAGNKVFGNGFEMVDPNTGDMITGGIITDITSGNQVVIYDDAIYYWRPDYSAEDNTYLYSRINRIMMFDANNNKIYDVMPSYSNVWGARYVPN